jgi:hypothetical protein
VLAGTAIRASEFAIQEAGNGGGEETTYTPTEPYMVYR